MKTSKINSLQDNLNLKDDLIVGKILQNSTYNAFRLITQDCVFPIILKNFQMIMVSKPIK